MRQSDGGAFLPSSSSASVITRNVSDGKVSDWCQFEAADSLRPVRRATAAVPPSAAITSEVVVRNLLITIPYNSGNLKMQVIMND